MWKRIQTLYLGISTALTVAMFFMNFATISMNEGETIKYYEKTSYLIMLIMLLTANICALLAYKMPILQSRVSMLSALIFVGFQIWLAIDFFEYKDEMSFSISIIFPIVSAILNALAARSALVDAMTITAAKSLKSKKKRK